jgi:hypothetical protein
VAVLNFFTVFYTLFFVWLTGLTAIFRFRVSLPFEYRGFLLLIMLLCVLETIGNALGYFGGIKNHFLFNILYAVELTALPFFFRFWLARPGIKSLIRVYMIIFPLFVVINTIWIQGFYTLQTYSFVFGGSFVLILVVTWLRELFLDGRAHNILVDPVFWFTLAYLTFFAVSVPYLGMMNYLWGKYPAFATLYYALIYEGTICLYNILLTIGLLCLKPITK